MRIAITESKFIGETPIFKLFLKKLRFNYFSSDEFEEKIIDDLKKIPY